MSCEPEQKKQTLIICAPSKDSDQPRYPPSRTSLRCVHEESIHEALSTNGSFLSDLVDVHAGLRLSCYDPENSGGGGGGGGGGASTYSTEGQTTSRGVQLLLEVVRFITPKETYSYL